MSTSLRPRKKPLVTTRRSAGQIYSKLGFEFNSAQQDPESFKHAFYATNMGRPDTPQHIRRVLRGLNRHVETKEKIFAAKEVGELLNPDFKKAVAGMGRARQKRKYKNWEKVSPERFTARMNALKHIGEASIDHVTPRLRQAATDVFKEVQKPRRQRKPVSPKEGIHINVERLSPKLLDQGMAGGANLFRRKITVPDVEGSWFPKRDVGTHEFLHVTDPGALKQDRAIKRELGPTGTKVLQGVTGVVSKVAGLSPALAMKMTNATSGKSPVERAINYYGDRREKHAYGGSMGSVGVETAKAAGIPADYMRHMQRRRKLHTLSDLDGPADLQAFGALEKYKQLQHISPKFDRAYRKLNKEVHWGVEKEYGSRNKGKRWNVYGTKMNAGPISRLPEDLQARISRLFEEAPKKFNFTQERGIPKIIRSNESGRIKNFARQITTPISNFDRGLFPSADVVSRQKKRIDTPGGVGSALQRFKQAREKKVLQNVAQHIPRHAQTIGSGLEAVALADMRPLNPARRTVFRISVADKNTTARPKSPHITQPIDVKRVGKFVVEKLPYRLRAHEGWRTAQLPAGLSQASRRIKAAETGRSSKLQLMTDPKGGHVGTKLIYDLFKDNNLVALDAHLGNIGLHPQTRKAELIDPGFVHKVPKERKQQVHDYLTRVDPTSVDLHTFHGGLARAAGLDRASLVGKVLDGRAIANNLHVMGDRFPTTEELQEYDEHSFKMDRFGNVHVSQLDRGKPGDYKFWEIHKAQQEPVLRPKDPPKPVRVQMNREDSKPSTARDRVLAYRARKTNEADEWEAKLQRIKAKLNPPKKTSRMGDLYNRLKVTNIVRNSAGQEMLRYHNPPEMYALQAANDPNTNPAYRKLWGKLGKERQDRTSVIPRRVNQQQVYDRVKGLELSLTKKNLKKAYKEIS